MSMRVRVYLCVRVHAVCTSPPELHCADPAPEARLLRMPKRAT